METDMSIHTCKNCDYYKPIHENADRGECNWLFKNKLPDAIRPQQSFMYGHEGEYCRCWKEKCDEKENDGL